MMPENSWKSLQVPMNGVIGNLQIGIPNAGTARRDYRSAGTTSAVAASSATSSRIPTASVVENKRGLKRA